MQQVTALKMMKDLTLSHFIYLYSTNESNAVPYLVIVKCSYQRNCIFTLILVSPVIVLGYTSKYMFGLNLSV